jgi:hypothetical protein
MTDKTITLTVKLVDAEHLLDCDGLALLFGVGAELIRAYGRKNTSEGNATFPPEWTKRGQRRAKEAMEHTGSSAMLDGLR